MVKRLRGVDVQVKLVADIQRGKDAEKNAKVVESRGGGIKPRVDIKTEVETYGASEFKEGGKASASTVATTPQQHGAPVAAGGGVLGFLMAEKGAAAPTADIPPFVEDPTQTKLEDLQRFQGMKLKVTSFDPDEYSSLQEANRRGDSVDSFGVLEEAKADALVMKREDGRTTELDPELWTVAEVEVERGPWSYKKEASSYADIDQALLPGAPVEVAMLGNQTFSGHLLGTGKDERGSGYVEILDDAGEKQRLKAADLVEVACPGFSFTALTRE
jgi:hypothetical protein